MIKMIFSDFDHTMLQIHSEKNTFDEYQFDILKKVREKGISFSIVTGRCVYFFLDRFSELLEYVDYIIASNGAVIYDVKNDKFIYKQLLDGKFLEKFLKYSDICYSGFLLNCLKEQYSEEDERNKYFSLKDIECEQLVVKFDKNNLDSIFEYLKNISGIIINNVSFCGESVSIDIDCKGVSKGNGIVWLCNHLGVSLEETVGFGDAENDVSVFEVVGKSVAVANAEDKIKNICDDVALTCGEDGIFHYIEENILK